MGPNSARKDVLVAPPFRLLTIAFAVMAFAPAFVQGGELIREQDAAGRVRVLREVGEDAVGNCVNNGLWQMLADDGTVAAEGRYEMGRRVGVWRRTLSAADVPPVLSELLRGFDAPLMSEAPFVAGEMSGTWTITDARGRRCFSIDLAAGVRQGEFKCWSPQGDVVRRESYRGGRLDGAAFEFSAADGQLAHTATWLKGYRLVRGEAYYEAPSMQKRSEGDYLVGPQSVVAADDFWSSRLAEHQFGGECLPHGVWRHWHANGQLAAEGRYTWGRPTGEFVWRHSNGLKAVAGSYAEGGNPNGQWRWWNTEGAQVAARTIGPVSSPVAPALQTARQSSAPAPTTVR